MPVLAVRFCERLNAADQFVVVARKYREAPMSEALSGTVVKINGFSLHRPRLAPVFAAIILVSLLSLVFVWSRIHAINLEYDVSSLERQIRLGQQQSKQLKLEAAYLSRDTRIEGLARKELGLRPPASGQIIRID